MSWVDDILKLDDEVVKVARNRKTEHVCKFLSNLLKTEVKITFKQIADKKYKRIAGKMETEGEDVAIANCEVIAEMANEMLEDRSILTNDLLMKKLGASDPNDLLIKMFPGSEIAELMQELSDIQEYSLKQITEDKKKSED